MKTEASAQLELEVQYATETPDVPSREDFFAWAQAALHGIGHPVELVIRVVDPQESRALNHRYRGKDKPTNVLSFPFDVPPGIESSHIGDVVICASVVAEEARQQGKPTAAHWAHMVVHGVLHLRGYDHQYDEEAQAMETLEKQILQEMGIDDPYRETELVV